MGLEAEPGQVKGRVVGRAGRSAWPRQVAGVGSDHEKRRWGRQQELDLRRHVEEFGLDLECSGELWGTASLGKTQRDVHFRKISVLLHGAQAAAGGKAGAVALIQTRQVVPWTVVGTPAGMEGGAVFGGNAGGRLKREDFVTIRRGGEDVITTWG